MGEPRGMIYCEDLGENWLCYDYSTSCTMFFLCEITKTYLWYSWLSKSPWTGRVQWWQSWQWSCHWTNHTAGMSPSTTRGKINERTQPLDVYKGKKKNSKIWELCLYRWLCARLYRWFSARRQYLQCISDKILQSHTKPSIYVWVIHRFSQKWQLRVC